MKTAGCCVLANISSAGVKSAFVGYGFQPGLQRVSYSSAALSAAGVRACVCQRHQRAIPWFTDMFSWVAGPYQDLVIWKNLNMKVKFWQASLNLLKLM